MPTYAFKCKNCNNEFELLQKIDDDAPTDCEKCGGPLVRVFHPVGIIFKGSGFYTTDYKRKHEKPAPSEAKSDKDKKADKTEKKTKPASKTPEKSTT